MMNVRTGFLVAVVMGLTGPWAAAQQTPAQAANRPPAVRSPEVHPDRRVTFRIAAPKASEVSVSGEFEVGAPPHPMQKDAEGVWSVTIGPFAPELYEYDFKVDGVQML